MWETSDFLDKYKPLLEAVKSGEVSIESAAEQIDNMMFEAYCMGYDQAIEDIQKSP